MNDEVEHGWQAYVGSDGKYIIATPGGHIAAWSENENDARLIVGELNHVAKLREQIDGMYKKSFTTRQGEAWKELEKRIAALEAIIAGQN